MPFRTALSGLNAASADLRVTGNNIANAGTTGFKGSRAEFADVFALSQGGVSQTAIGTGTRLASVTQEFSQGNIDFTDNNLDLALNGQGFFILNDGGTNIYSRAGAFQANRDGFVVNPQGQRLQVYPAQGAGQFNTAEIVDLQLSTAEREPQATSEIRAQLNLSAEAAIFGDEPEFPGFDPTDPDTFNNSTSLTVFDSLGRAQTATLYFRRIEVPDDAGDGTASSWEVLATVQGSEDEEGLIQRSVGRLDFDGSGNGVLDEGGSDLTEGFPLGGDADNLVFGVDLDDVTQFGGAFSVGRLSQDGFAAGRLSSIDIDPSGVVFAQFTNGQTRSLGKIALANFANPQGLQPLGNNAWGASFAAGEVITGEADSGAFGLVQSGGLETSNVDIAQQLVNLITAQRNFQANAQVISTADTITQTIINIR